MNRLFRFALLGVFCLGTAVSLNTVSDATGRGLLEPAQAQTQPSAMTLAQLEATLQAEVNDLEGGSGQWRMTINDRPVVVLADVQNNRMRIVSPVTAVETLTPEQVQRMMAANFHSALDARYAVTDRTVVSVFVHPLGSLQQNDLRSALQQVVSLADTFGSSYSSQALEFNTNNQRRVPRPSNGNLAI